MTVQYFVNYNFDNRFLTPLGGGGGRVFNIGKQPVSVFLGGYYNVARPMGKHFV